MNNVHLQLKLTCCTKLSANLKQEGWLSPTERASVSANQPKAHFGPPWVRQTSYPEAEALSLSTSLIQPSRVNLNAVSKSIVYGIVATTRSP